MLCNQNIEYMATELFINCRKRNNSIAFKACYYLAVPERVRLNSSHFCIMKPDMNI